MSLRTLPKITALSGQHWHMREDCLDNWNPAFSALATAENSISILDTIGEDFLTGEGVTGKRIGAALRSIGENPVVVNINSPGGDYFEGVAIYNMLRAHPAKVTVRVVGLAASSASIIAMAGDEIQIGQAGFLMIHNAWSVCVGNRLDMLRQHDDLAVFDTAMAELYSARTGISSGDIQALMDEETWFTGSEAVAKGFADANLPSDLVAEINPNEKKQMKAVRVVDNALRAAYPTKTRSELRSITSGFSTAKPSAGESGKPSAAEQVKPSADLLTEALSGLLTTLKA